MRTLSILVLTILAIPCFASTIGVDPSFISFAADEGGSNPSDQIISIWNSGTGVLDWDVTEGYYDSQDPNIFIAGGCAWLSVSPTSGSSTDPNDATDVMLSVDTTGMTWGQYSCGLMISDPLAENNPQTVTVDLDIDGPIIELSRSAIGLGVDAGMQISYDITITNIGAGTLNWTINETCEWLSASPASGSSTGESDNVTLWIDTRNLADGDYICNIAVSDPLAENTSQIVTLSLNVFGPSIGLSTNALNFKTDAVGANPADQTLTITNISAATLDWSVSESCSWFSISPASGSSTGEGDDVTLSVDITGISEGVYNCQLLVSDPMASNNPQVVNVSLYHGVDLVVPNPYPAIQVAIDVADHGDTIIVEPGTYYENINFGGKDIILTSIDPDDPAVVAATIIDGSAADSVVTFSGTETSACELTGFTITNGKADYSWLNDNYGGGGINGNASHATISNCIIRDNIAEGYYDDMDVPVDYSFAYGGGLYDCDGAITNCMITGNSVTECGFGGGLALCDGAITNCLIANNSVAVPYYYGGGGGGLYLCYSTITNCTITSNSAGYGGGIDQGNGAITNCIIYGNSNSQLESCSAPTYSCIQDWTGGGVANIIDDPIFVSGEYGDYYLSQIAAGQGADSPCVDAGSDTAINLGMDIYTTSTYKWFDTGVVDMGYHYVDNLPTNLGGSKSVDYADLAILGSQWQWDNHGIYEPNEVGWWSFDEGAGVDAYDSSVYGRDGMLVNDPNWVLGHDGTGSAISFDGDYDEYVEITGYKGVAGSLPRTTAAWVKTSDPNSIISWGDSGVGKSWRMRAYQNAANDIVLAVETGADSTSGSTPIDDGLWHHVAASFDGQYTTLYVDGVADSDPNDMTVDTGINYDVRIGPASFSGSEYFDGQIDDVRIYEYGLNAEMINNLYNGLAPAGVACLEYPAADFTGDCIVDINDLLVFAEDWLWP